MTSLFRRSSSNGGSRGGGGGGGGSGGSTPGDLNNSRPNRQVRRLEFNQAMEDFKIMFPTMDYEVIECVLRSNNGAVDATIDQLLQMSIDGEGSDDSSDSDDSIPTEVLERTLEPDSSDEEPPPVYSPPTYDMHIYDRKYPEAPPTPPPRFEAQPPPGHRQVRSYRNWNPPLLGNLPDDFLRILPQQLDSIQGSQSSLSQPSSSSLSSIAQRTAQGGISRPGAGGALGAPGGPGGAEGVEGAGTEQERKLKQYLDDERIALFLQNEEFMRELQRNREFLVALERDRLKYESKKSKSNHSSSYMENSTAGEHCASGSMEACTAVSDDAMFRDKLKHMGKSTRKKLFEIARSFSDKTKRRKLKRRTLLKHQSLGIANSTANLLEDVEGSPEDGQPRRSDTQEDDVPHKEPLS
ncbi:CUE domain-containing protein 1 [Salmo salar]|uniref:CUE domain-containing protein 1 n=1 Tax=Salmo salar TaxID=8030 RepID=A0A1S3NTB4_SALSA|nr:CUE domain-containing protein 1 [Salmo salar]XP_045559844.1 CUE domain-containing protein 1 [Salmo salar]XP_045559845.1 CUE domain-containing protein 1 [Salmo salar]XP_045559846.1 CUE domain-containing protein 1 [Salmo salar]XP_045559847.1 CUE domain-containing protein 1 [Salmo salar]XP_045559848.1 CUE domain-containing protein 1 [Salmo salar]|eukprot:XP_014018663.1 PREDICTED: CUE domain-containing protein 1-like isoform X2 [Salmo salar]